MAIIDIEPDTTKPPPYVTRPDEPSSFIEEVQVAGKTAELLHELGAPLETDEESVTQTKSLLQEAIKNKKTSNLTNINTAFAAAAFLKTYGQHLAFDVASARAAITNKLMELANCGEPKFELKALELLGKHSDIGIFTERSEITINYKSPEDLENAIKSRVKRLLNAQIIDVTPIQTSLDDELGVAKSEEELTVLVSELGGGEEDQKEGKTQENQEDRVAV